MACLFPGSIRSPWSSSVHTPSLCSMTDSLFLGPSFFAEAAFHWLHWHTARAGALARGRHLGPNNQQQLNLKQGGQARGKTQSLPSSDRTGPGALALTQQAPSRDHSSHIGTQMVPQVGFNSARLMNATIPRSVGVIGCCWSSRASPRVGSLQGSRIATGAQLGGTRAGSPAWGPLVAGGLL